VAFIGGVVGQGTFMFFKNQAWKTFRLLLLKKLFKMMFRLHCQISPKYEHGHLAGTTSWLQEHARIMGRVTDYEMKNYCLFVIIWWAQFRDRLGTVQPIFLKVLKFFI